jgi:hypothetical protein
MRFEKLEQWAGPLANPTEIIENRIVVLAAISAIS